MTEMMTIPIGYVAIPIYEYQYLLSLKPRDEEKAKPIEENTTISFADANKSSIAIATKPTTITTKSTADATPKRTPRGKNITTEQVEEMNRLRQGGMSVPKIAEQMGIGEQTVRNHLAAYAKTHPSAAMKYANRMTMAGMVQ